MKAIIIFVGFLVICACDYASAGCDKAYATVGAGYKFDEPTNMTINGMKVNLHKTSPYTARFEIGIVCNENLRFGISHDSQWATGAPFNNKGEPFKSEFFIDYTVYWSL